MKNIATYSQEVFLDCTEKDFSNHLENLERAGLKYIHLRETDSELFKKLKGYNNLASYYKLAGELEEVLNKLKENYKEIYINFNLNNQSTALILFNENLTKNFNLVFSFSETTEENFLVFYKMEKVKL